MKLLQTANPSSFEQAPDTKFNKQGKKNDNQAQKSNPKYEESKRESDTT